MAQRMKEKIGEKVRAIDESQEKGTINLRHLVEVSDVPHRTE
jgi:hypothetical protein